MKVIPETTRKAIFAAIVEAEDSGTPPTDARKDVAARFRITPEVARAIANEGADKAWPPLEDD